MTSPSLRVGYVPGATPAKWVRIWGERHPDTPLELVPVDSAAAADAVRAGAVDVALMRLPSETSGLAVIPLYEEVTVVVVPKDHVITAVDEITAADLNDEHVLVPHDDTLAWADAPGAPVAHRPDTTADAIELVAAGTGVLLVPQSLARLHHRKDLTYRPLTDAPPAPVVLAAAEGVQSDEVAEFIGVVRGRRAGSSRGKAEPAPKRSAREKTLAKQAARAAAGKRVGGKAAGKPGRTGGPARRGRR